MNKKSPLVSIITGYYNRKENLEESVNSVLSQDYENFEYIIFDDCSTDGTYELLSEFKDERLNLIRHDKNIGFTKGIIWAIAQAKGDLIAIHGAGDISFANRIRKQVDFLESNMDYTIVGCTVEDVSSEGKNIHKPANTNGSLQYTQGEVMYRKKSYYQAGGYNPLFYYGQFTNLKLELLKLGKGGYIDEVLYRRIHFKNGVTKNSKKRVLQKLYILLGTELSKNKNLYEIDIDRLSILTCLPFINRFDGDGDEALFFKMLSRRSLFLKKCYSLCKKGIIPRHIFIKLSYYFLK